MRHIISYSINIPSEDIIEVTDHIGMVSGKSVDKSGFFKVFYGELKTAPMIEEAPINLECKVIKTIDLEKGHEIFIGEVKGAYADDNFYTNNTLDIKKIKPIIYSTGQKKYYSVGDTIGKAWNIGRDYKLQ